MKQKPRLKKALVLPVVTEHFDGLIQEQETEYSAFLITLLAEFGNLNFFVIKKNTKVLTGALAAAEAMRQIEPDVVPVYPITPQTPIAESFAKFIADGKVKTEMIRAESEHSVMSASAGASAAGARVMTASSSAGLALMWEVLGVVSGMRLPVVMNIANRALSSPINIHCDHSDSMGARDQSWIQIYSETAQEVYENTILAVRLAEEKEVLLPVMVMQDGFIVSHGAEKVQVLPDKKVKSFVGAYVPQDSLLNIKTPVTYGPLALPDYFFEFKRQQVEAMKNALKKYLEIGGELSKITGNKYPYIENYFLDDAEAAIITLSSTCGTVKGVVDKLRGEGKKVGLLKIRLFRPFPYEEIREALRNAKSAAVLDRSLSFGAKAALFSEIKNSICDLDKKPLLQSYIFGLGGRDITSLEIEAVFKELLEKKITEEEKYIGLRE